MLGTSARRSQGDDDLGHGPAKIDENGLTFGVRIEPHGPGRPGSSVAAEQPRGGRLRDAGRNMQRDLEKWLDAAPRLECD